jgi:hypothetical protein
MTVVAVTRAADLSTAEAGERIVALEQSIRRLQAEQAELVRTFDARQGADADGAASTACWLRDRLRLSDRDARQLVGLARSLDRLPLMAAALACGAVTPAHVRVLDGHTKRLDAAVIAEGEPHLVKWARDLDSQRFGVVVRRWVATVAPAAYERDTEARYDARWLTVAQTFGGMTSLSGMLEPEGGGIVTAALDALVSANPADDARSRDQQRDARWLTVAQTFGGMTSLSGMLEPEGGGIVTAALDALVSANPADDARSRDQQRADALVDLIELARSHDLLPVTGGNRPEILVHATVAALIASTDGTGPAADPGAVATLDTAHALTPGALDRLGCDARFRRLLVDPVGVPLDLGRSTRLVPPALRKQVALRDGGCRYPGCPRPAAYCEAHHAVYWRHGGTTSADNLVLLCRYHHHLVHDRHHHLTLQPDGTVKVTTPTGRVLTSRPRGPTAAPV